MTAASILPRATSAGVDPKAWAFPLTDRTNSLYDFLDFGTFDDARQLAVFEEKRFFSVGFGIEFQASRLTDSWEQLLEALIDRCPADTVLQFGTASLPLSDSFFASWSAAHSTQGPVLDEYTRRLQEVFRDPEASSKYGFGEVADTRITRQYLFALVPFDAVPRSEEERRNNLAFAERLREDVQDLLRQQLPVVKVLTREGFRELMEPLVFPRAGTTGRTPAGEKDSTPKDVLRLPSQEADRDIIVTPLTVEQLPDAPGAHPGTMALFGRTSIEGSLPPYWAYTTIHVLHHEKSRDWLTRKFAQLRTSRRMLSPTGEPAFSQRVHNTERLLTQASLGHRLVRAYVGINVYSAAHNQRDAVAAVSRSFIENGFRLRSERLVTAPVFIASLPFQYRPSIGRQGKGLQRATLMHSLNAASLVPLLARKSDQPASGGLLLTTHRGEMCALDIWNTAGSHNFLMLGSDERKVQAFGSEIVANTLSRSGRALVLDLHGQYVHLGTLTGASCRHLSRETPLSFNPVTRDMICSFESSLVVDLLVNMGLRGAHRNMYMVQYASQLVETVLHDLARCPGVEPSLRAVYEALAYEGLAGRAMDTVAIELCQGLQPFAVGEYAQWFEGSGLDLRDDLTVLDFSGLSANTRSSAAGGVLTQVLAGCAMVTWSIDLPRRQRHPQMMFVSDTAALNAFQEPEMLDSLMRRQRRYNGALGFAQTHSFEKVLTSGIGRTLLDNTSRRFLLPASLREARSYEVGGAFSKEVVTQWNGLRRTGPLLDVLLEDAVADVQHLYRFAPLLSTPSASNVEHAQ
jgi:conjugal transfer ATP-binding protein TraC